MTTHYAPTGLHYALGFIPVPSRMIYWAELLIIQMITPNASFTGRLTMHLCHILLAPNFLSFTGGTFTPSLTFRGYFHPQVIKLEGVTLCSKSTANPSKNVRVNKKKSYCKCSVWILSVMHMASPK